MPAGDVVPTLITFLHDLFTVVWVGGMLTLALVVLPVARTALGPGPQVQRLMSAIHARLRWFVYASIAGLAVTGVMLAQRSDAFGGFFTWGDGYGVALSLKHVAVILMAVVALTRSALLTRQAAAGAQSSRRRHGTGVAAAGRAVAAGRAGAVVAGAAALCSRRHGPVGGQRGPGARRPGAERLHGRSRLSSRRAQPAGARGVRTEAPASFGAAVSGSARYRWIVGPRAATRSSTDAEASGSMRPM